MPISESQSPRLGLQELQQPSEPPRDREPSSLREPRSASGPWQPAVAVPTQSVCVFRLAGELYGLDTALVREVVKVREIRWLPRVAPAILGACNLRGEILPVVAPELLLELPQSSEPDGLGESEPTLLIVQLGPDRVGLRIRRAESVAQVLEPHSVAGKPAEELSPSVQAELRLTIRGRSVPVWLLEPVQLRLRLDALTGRA